MIRTDAFPRASVFLVVVQRLGRVHVDFKTQQRIPKLSAAWFKEAARLNAVV
jgi:beta-glucosidase/6-phospho-beta-glucosidase/beta-galactosidase